jgi:cytochrome b
MSASQSLQPRSIPVRGDWVAVWDPLVRTGHWVLAAAFALAYLTGEDETGANALHVWSGYVVGAVVILRILWGFVGPRRARFGDFAYGPATALRYLADLVRGRARRYLGHSPAGGLMVMALLLCLVGTVATGLVAYGERGKGPLAGSMFVSAPTVRVVGRDHERASRAGRGEEAENAIGELHAVLANVTLGLVVLHLLGVAVASVAHRENLVASMVHGRKREAS